MRNLKYFWKLSLLMVSRYLGEHYVQIVSKDFFIEGFKYQKYTKII